MVENMSFWDHLEAFRWTLIRSLAALVIFTVLAFAFMPYIYDNVVIAPSQSGFFLYRYLCIITSAIPFLPDFCDNSFNVDIININLASQFFRHVTTSLWLAFIFTFPYLMFEVWRFIKSALYEKEKKSFRWVFVFATLMFFVGCGVGYALVFPVTLHFLAGYQLSETIVNQISLDSYMDNFLMMIFIMGIVFELPLVSMFLSFLGLVDKTFFRKYRRHAIVGLLILSAIITPSGDPFTLSVVFIPLYTLYEVSCFFVKTKRKVSQINSGL